MTTTHLPSPAFEPLPANHPHHLVCWKSVVGGLLIALMASLFLTALGAGVAGFTSEHLISKEEGGSALATGAGLWLGLSVVVSLFCGSYFSLRISKFVTHKVGAAHGFLISSIFFLLLVFGAGNVIGGLAQGFGTFAKGAGEGASNLSSNPAIQDTINKSMASGNLKSDPKDVAQGLATRLMQGDTESAKNYYAYQTGLSSADVDAKMNQMKADFDAAVKRAAEKTAHAVGDTGIFLSVLFLVGLISAVVGGRIGAQSNVERPFAKVDYSSPVGGLNTLKNERGSAAPYLVGWLLGVPVSLLVLIALLRSIF